MLNYKTYKQLDHQAMEMLGLENSAVHVDVRRQIINDRVFQMYAILRALNDPWYDRLTTLTIGADTAQIYWNNNGSPGAMPIDGIVASTNTVKRNSGSFVAGQLIFCQYTNFNALFLSNSDWFVGRILTGGATATYEVLDGTDIDTNVDVAVSVIIQNKLSQLSVSISGLYVSKIIGIFDDQGVGNGSRQFYHIPNQMEWENVYRDADYFSRVAWTLEAGNNIVFSVGKNAAAMGVVQMHYLGKPGIYTEATENNAIDIPPEENQVLLDEVMYALSLRVTGQVSDVLQKRHDYFSKRYDAARAEEMKAMEKKGKRD